MTDSSSRKIKEQRKKQRHEQVRAEILDAVIDLVMTEGSKDIRLLHIAKRIGVTKQAIYHYYNSKESLIFDVITRELTETANLIEEAVLQAQDGIAAMEMMMRTFFNRYVDRLNVFSLVYNSYPHIDISEVITKKNLGDIHSLNKKLFGRCEKLLKVDQKNGSFPSDRRPRLFIFNAQTSIIGILNMMAMTKSIQDPLIHSNKSLIDDICLTFKTAALGEVK